MMGSPALPFRAREHGIRLERRRYNGDGRSTDAAKQTRHILAISSDGTRAGTCRQNRRRWQDQLAGFLLRSAPCGLRLEWRSQGGDQGNWGVAETGTGDLARTGRLGNAIERTGVRALFAKLNRGVARLTLFERPEDCDALLWVREDVGEETQLTPTSLRPEMSSNGVSPGRVFHFAEAGPSRPLPGGRRSLYADSSSDFCSIPRTQA